jgi:hypothetical protein
MTSMVFCKDFEAPFAAGATCPLVASVLTLYIVGVAWAEITSTREMACGSLYGVSMVLAREACSLHSKYCEGNQDLDIHLKSGDGQEITEHLRREGLNTKTARSSYHPLPSS